MGPKKPAPAAPMPKGAKRKVKVGQEECILILDTQILNESFGANLTARLVESDLKYEIRNQLIPMSISFERKSEENICEESVLLMILQGSDVISWMETGVLVSTIKSHADIYPDKKVSLFIFGFRKFLRHNNSRLSRVQIETEFTRLQLHTGISHRLIEKPVDLEDSIIHFARSVEELPSKRRKFLETENFYFANDNKDSVKVQDHTRKDSSNPGLSRLWQQHLLKLPFITLETAEAILSVYPMPKDLLDAFKSSPSPETLLRDIPVRRGGGPLTTNRRLGPEMSRKLFQFYHSLDPSEMLSN